MFQVIEEINIKGLKYTAQICREDDTDNVMVPAGLKEVDLGVGAVPIEEEQSPQAISLISSIRVQSN